MSKIQSMMAGALAAEKTTPIAGVEHLALEQDTTNEYFEAKADLDLQVEMIDQAEQVAGGLETLLAQAEAAAENGGMNEAEAALFAIAADATLTPFGGAENVLLVPAQENYSEDGGRHEATVAACEALGETAKKVWDTIVKFIKDMAKKIQMFFVKNVALVGRLKGRAEKLKEAAGEISDSLEQKEAELKLGGAVKFFAKGGKVQDDVVKNVEEMLKLVEDMSGSDKVGSAAVKYAESFVAATKEDSDAKSLEITNGAAATFYKDVAAAYGLKAVTGDDRFNDDKVEVSKGEEYLGGKSVFLAITKTKGGNKAKLEKLALMDAEDKAPKFTGKETIKALDKAGIVSLAEAVIKLCDKVIALKEEDKALDKMGKDLLKVGDDLKGVMDDKEESVVAKGVAKFGMMLIRGLASKAHQPVVSVAGHATSVANAATNFGIQSKDNYKKPEAKKDDKKEGEE